MKVRAEFVRTPLAGPFRPTWGPGMVLTHATMILVHVETDEGLVGIGAGPCGGPASAALVDAQVGPLVVGLDPLRTETVAERLAPVAREYAWPWCVELAVWDLVGKIHGRPLHELLGGYHESLPAYASFGERRGPEQRVEDVHAVRERGFGAVKLRFRADDVESDLAVVRAVREAHADVAVLVDANQGSVMPTSERYRIWDLKTARYVGDALADLGVVWLEEPLPKTHFRELAELTRSTRIAVAGGELNSGLHEFQAMVEQRSYDVVQADAAFSGGIAGTRRIAALAEAAGLSFVPHTWSSDLGFYANFHLALSVPSCTWLEVPFDPPVYEGPLGSTLLAEPFSLGPDGRAYPPDGPGLGVELDPAALAAAAV